ncbi:hypothetical protein [Sinorhizobium mexicanum]|uniref:hypothetical protein n=1 Tax=Sinorhizobium mexicanum TaxID=375549 RepID=UPI0015DF4104|nr:hypothetical protein [Sinorhizobium mexicanum]MBP1885991.1 hypothetical protein [Sinorhizobium mexicanum]
MDQVNALHLEDASAFLTLHSERGERREGYNEKQSDNSTEGNELMVEVALLGAGNRNSAGTAA